MSLQPILGMKAFFNLALYLTLTISLAANASGNGLTGNTSEDQTAESSLFNDPGHKWNWYFRESENYGISFEKAAAEINAYKSNEIIVAVIDTGVEETHEDLINKMWTNKNEIPNNGIDDDMNGYIDDIHGINTLNRDENGNATGKITDQYMHGTHVAGILAAEQNNLKGIAGISSHVKIMALKAIPSDKDESDRDVAEAIYYAAKNGAKIINCSFGKNKNTSNLVYNALKKVSEDYGVLIVAASGNFFDDLEKKPFYPASFDLDSIITVTATSSDGALNPSANYGIKSVDVAAPGVSIYSTTIKNSYILYSGTSMAAPVVSGIAAELWAHFPHLTAKDLKNIILASVIKNQDLKGKILTEGIVDFYQAYLLAKGMNL